MEHPMSTDTQNETKAEEKVMCYVSKKLVPISETVEVQYSADKKYRVLPRYVKY
jgi:hypothetical protein